MVRGLLPLWTWLQRVKPITEPVGKYVFPVWFECEDMRNETWLAPESRTETITAGRLTRRLIFLESAIGMGRKIAMRARRWCRTEMLKSLAEHVVSAQMGHSSDIGDSCYTKNRAVVISFPPPKVTDARLA